MMRFAAAKYIYGLPIPLRSYAASYVASVPARRLDWSAAETQSFPCDTGKSDVLLDGLDQG
jgi:hypothetical protein